MGNISTNFNRSEFACKCGCGQDSVDAELITILEIIREKFNLPIEINSGNRCVVYNKSVGGGVSSQHLKGRAADIDIEGVPPAEIQDYVDQIWPNLYGMGRYETFTHVDSRGGKARWEG